MGCSPGDPEPSADAGHHAVDADATSDRVGPDVASDGASDGASENDDAPRGLVVLPAQFTELDTPLRMLAEGDSIDLWPAPQGGHVVLVAAKVRNFVGDTAVLRVQARYADT